MSILIKATSLTNKFLEQRAVPARGNFEMPIPVIHAARAEHVTQSVLDARVQRARALLKPESMTSFLYFYITLISLNFFA